MPGRLVVVFLIALIGCSRQPDTRLAPTAYYFFEINDLEGSGDSQKIIDYLETGFRKHKYAITWKSGSEAWPWYEKFDLEESVPFDSLMTPHTHSHVMIPIGEFRPDLEPSFRLVINYSLEEDSHLTTLVIFRRDGDSWKQEVDTGDHRVYFEDTPDPEEQKEMLLKTLVRYSFK